MTDETQCVTQKVARWVSCCLRYDSGMAVLVAGPRDVNYAFGLFSAAQVEESNDHIGVDGVQWETLDCQNAQAVPVGSCTAVEVGTLPKELDNNLHLVHGVPFAVAGHFACSPLGYTIEKANQWATAHLALNEEFAVETLLWNAVQTAVSGGSQSFLPGLALEDATTAFTAETLSPTTDFTTASYAKVAWLIGALEDYNAKHYGRMGVIHLPRVVAEIAVASGAAYRQGARLFTALNTPVVAGGGYTWSADLAGFVSPPVGVYRGAVRLGGTRQGPLVDKGQNLLYGLAERIYALSANTACTWGYIKG